MDEDAALKRLFDAFGAVCSLEEIASAYLKAEGDLHAASEILFQSQETENENSDTLSIEFQNDKRIDKSKNLEQISTSSGNGYDSPISSHSKPMKISVKERVADCGSLGATSPVSVEDVSTEDQGTIDFLFSLLGDGFKLEKGSIKDVLRSCGYDAKKTAEHFLETASSKLGKERAFSPNAENELDVGSSDISLEVKISISTRSSHLLERDARLSSACRKSRKLKSSRNEKSTLQKEILQSLFCAPKVPEEASKKVRLPMGLNRTKTFGQRAISAPLDDVDSTPSVELPEVLKDEDKEDDYEVHRKAAKHNWDMMRTYYEAAVDAFTKDEHRRVDYLQEQGNFYLKKAQEANEKSGGLVFVKGEGEDEFPLKLDGYSPKEAVRILKSHLQYLVGIPTYMKIHLSADAGDSSNEKRRKLVLQFLDKESIQWTEEAGTIGIHVGAIDPGKLRP